MTKLARAFLIGFLKAAGLSPAVAPGATAATPTANSNLLAHPVTKMPSGQIVPRTNSTQSLQHPAPATPDIYSRIKQNEGFRPSVYNDTLGKATIGYGSTDPRLLKMKHITEPVAAQSLTNHVNQVMQNTADTLGTQTWDKTPVPIQDSLIDLGYQTGKWPKLTDAVRHGDYNQAINEMTNSKVNSQTPERNAQRVKIIQDYLNSMQQQNHIE
jgi:GH24 family phage-related lysozyme (muramidase)